MHYIFMSYLGKDSFLIKATFLALTSPFCAEFESAAVGTRDGRGVFLKRYRLRERLRCLVGEWVVGNG